jgi:hypothetical protein
MDRTDDLAARIWVQDVQLRVDYGFGAEAVAINPKDARILDATTVCGIQVYLYAGMVPGVPEIVSPEETRRRYGGSPA